MMQVTIRDTGDAVVLSLEGRLVLEDVEAELRGAIDGLIEQGRVRLVLNMSDVAYIDSAGLGFLVSKYVSVHRRGGNMVFVGVSPRVAHVLAITRLAQVFEVFASEEEAVRAVVLVPAHAPVRPFTSRLR